MSERTPRELEELRQRMLAAARSERPSASAASANRDAVLSGKGPAAGLEAPPVGGRRVWPRRAAIAFGLLALLLAWWFLTRGVAPLPAEPMPLVPEPLDAGVPARAPEPVPLPVLPVEPPPPSPVDAGVAPKPKRPVVDAEDPDLLARELALLDEARGHLKAGPQRTLEVLARHAREFPRGALRSEADLVKLEALLALGRQADADRLAARLTAADREGLVRERVKRLLAAPH